MYTKAGQWKCCLALGIVCVGLGAALLAEAGKVQELKLEYGTKDKFVEFELSEDWKSDVFFYYELGNFYGNYKNFVENREKLLVDGSLMKYKCTNSEGASANTKEDAKAIRVSPASFADLGKHITDDVVHEGEEQELFPCGLVSLSMFLDEYSLYKVDVDGEPAQVDLNFENIAWKTDMEMFNAKMEEANGNTTIDGKMSWLKTDLMKQRFAIWYRTSASATVRHLWAKIPGGLAKGKYKVTFDVNGPIWDDWKVTKYVVISTVSSIGGKNSFMGMLCIIWGVVLLLSGLFWLVAPNPVKKVVDSEEA